MSIRWHLERVRLFSGDGQFRDVEFNAPGITVICAGSHAGKSALIEVIDYTLGASKWRAADHVRVTCAWVATVWRSGEHRVFAARRVPTGAKRESAECSFAVLGDGNLPCDAQSIPSNCNTSGLKLSLEQQFGIGTVKGESFGQRIEESRISVRNATPYLFQSDDVIVNKGQLLRGLGGDRRVSHLAAAPYFFGAVDEQTTAQAHRLRVLGARKRALERQLDVNNRNSEMQAVRLAGLLAEAVELGLLGSEVLRFEDADGGEALKILLDWTSSGTEIVAENPQLGKLRETEGRLLERLGEVDARRRSAEELLRVSGRYANAMSGQRQRLEVVGLFRDVEDASCPVCGSDTKHEETAAELEAALLQLKDSLANVSRDRPKLDAHIEALDSAREEVVRDLRGVRAQVSAIIKERDNIQRQLALSSRRERLVGRISLYLESLPSETEVDRLVEALLDLTKEMEALEAVVARSAVAERMNELRQRVSFVASELMYEMPGDTVLQTGQLDVDLRKMEVGLVTSARRLSMEEVGSDENYLTIHLSSLLAMHRILAVDNCPVPSLLVLDQISRPYFPADESMSPISVGSANERQKLAQYFDAIVSELETNEDLQVIILEHALLADHEGYMSAVKYVWGEDEGLIPEGWPKSEA